MTFCFQDFFFFTTADGYRHSKVKTSVFIPHSVSRRPGQVTGTMVLNKRTEDDKDETRRGGFAGGLRWRLHIHENPWSMDTKASHTRYKFVQSLSGSLQIYNEWIAEGMSPYFFLVNLNKVVQSDCKKCVCSPRASFTREAANRFLPVEEQHHL